MKWSLKTPFGKILSFCLILILLLCPQMLKAQSDNHFYNRTYDAGFGIGVLGSGEVDMDFMADVSKKKTSYLIKGFFDTYLIPKLAVGVYLNIASAPIELEYEYSPNREVRSFVWEIGGSFKPRFFIGQNWAIKPGISFGYRKFYFNEDDLEDIDMLQYFEAEDEAAEASGMGVNGSVEIQRFISTHLIACAEAGFFTQPYGGTDDVTELDFGPILYLLVGLQF